MNAPHFSRTTTAFRPLDTTTALRPARLLCPACARNEDGETESVLESALVDGTEFHRCKTCAGVWFHVKDLDTALKAASKGEWPQPRAELADSDGISTDWSCPCCGGRLIDVKDRHGSGVAVHRCLVCYGGWIEFPDLQRAEERMGGMLARLGRVVRAVLPS